MFVITLKFTDKRDKAAQYLDGHKNWLAEYFGKGVFLAAGTLEPKLGGVILAHKTSPQNLHDIIKEDPFVKENIVITEILDVSVQKTCDEFRFLMMERE